MDSSLPQWSLSYLHIAEEEGPPAYFQPVGGEYIADADVNVLSTSMDTMHL